MKMPKAEKGVHFALYPSDWLAGTRGLTPAETGVYITLCCMMYERQEALPLDTARLARMCNCPAGTFRKTLDSLIAQGKILETPGGLWNHRVEREIFAAVTAMNAASEKGRKAVEARWAKERSKSDHHENEVVTSRNVEQENSFQTGEKTHENNEGGIREYYSSNTNQNQNIRGGGGYAGVREAPNDPTWREQLLAEIGVGADGIAGPSRFVGSHADMQTAARWEADLGLPRESILAVIRETVAAKQDGPPASFSYFNRPMSREAARLAAPPLTPTGPEEFKHDRKSAHDRRQAAADDRFGRILDAAVRNRAPSRGDFGFG